MRRAAFFVVLLACGAPRETQHVEIAQPLPTFTATAQPPPSATARGAERDAVDDVRDLRSRQRPLALLKTETQGLESLLTATSASSTDRPALLRRLAENYVEMRKVGDPGASVRAIARYRELVSTVQPTYPHLDEVYYYLALELEIVGEMSEARRNYFELIKREPSSKLVPYAYFAFGELFFHEAKTDPAKWSLAQQAYMEVMKFASAPLITSEAACRLGQVFDAQGDAQRAASMRAKAGHPCG
jgi:TolA-binding protein